MAEEHVCDLCGRSLPGGSSHASCVALKAQGYTLTDTCYGMTGGDRWDHPVKGYVVNCPHLHDHPMEPLPPLAYGDAVQQGVSPPFPR